MTTTTPPDGTIPCAQSTQLRRLSHVMRNPNPNTMFGAYFQLRAYADCLEAILDRQPFSSACR
jgi:hypothetical protein